MSNVELLDSLTISECNTNPSKIYVFGDNLLCTGKGGQAIIRDCDNAYGIPTKREPSMRPTAFFSDEFEEYEAVKRAIENIYIITIIGRTVVFPTSGLGTGLARMKEHSPKLFKYMNKTIYHLFGVYNEYIS